MSRHESGKTLNILRTLGIETEKVTLPHVSKASASTVVERQVKLEMQGSEARCLDWNLKLANYKLGQVI